MKYPSRGRAFGEETTLAQLPVTPGEYETRTGRRAIVTDSNESLSDGYIEPSGTAGRRSCCWSTRNGWAAGVGRSAWDLVKRVDQ